MIPGTVDGLVNYSPGCTCIVSTSSDSSPFTPGQCQVVLLLEAVVPRSLAQIEHCELSASIFIHYCEGARIFRIGPDIFP